LLSLQVQAGLQYGFKKSTDTWATNSYATDVWTTG